jgi:hypothetical protein
MRDPSPTSTSPATYQKMFFASAPPLRSTCVPVAIIKTSVAVTHGCPLSAASAQAPMRGRRHNAARPAPEPTATCVRPFKASMNFIVAADYAD